MTRSAPRPRRPLSIYYGPPTPRALAALRTFETVVVQTTLYPPRALNRLRAGGTRVLGYLSVGEDHALGDWACVPGSAPYHSGDNPEWGSVRVDAGHPGWREILNRRADEALHAADGLLLDTLDSAAAAGILERVQELRSRHPDTILLANRGFELLPDLAPEVSGVLFEAFSTTHSPAYALHDEAGLAYTAHWQVRLQDLGLPVVALDYADTPALARLARAHAARHGLHTFVTDRALSRPTGQR